VKPSPLDDYLDCLTSGEIFKPSSELVVGFDNHMFPDSFLSIGREPLDERPGHLCIQGRAGVIARFTRAGLVLRGERLNDKASLKLLHRLFPTPAAYEMKTSDQVSFKIARTGDVFINDRKIGRSSRLLTAMLAHLLLTALPLCKQWQPQIQTPSKRRHRAKART
jgi:hypothetical protein